MCQQLRHLWAALAFGFLVLTSGGVAMAEPVTGLNTFTPNTAATAASVNDNFSAVKSAVDDNDSRISAMESSGAGPEVAVDCSGDANALLNITILNNTTYTLTGMCNGPIEVFRNRNVVIQGAVTNTKTDGIILPTGITVDSFAAIGA